MTGTIVVTGAARGIGRAIAEKLASTGPFTVVGVDFAPELALAESIVPVQVDLTGDEGPDAVVDMVQSLDQPLLGLVNNAGITRDSRLVNMSEDDFNAVVAVNLGATYRLSSVLAPLIHSGGAIVNIASRAYLGNFGQFNYSISKGGVVGLTRAMAITLAPDVRVNAIAPGLIATEMSMAIPEDIREKMISAIPMARMGTAEEIANTVWFLISPISSYITGHVVVVGGGRSLT
ncbi:MAG: SDR family oxidoreductase [Acidimicrobiia bacterium]|nr:SDR family oxidoreductase [Acidimicrobiia bacterium]MDH3464039.1 SDR family oxidoreductase [Acidimicrobiia bacterium]